MEIMRRLGDEAATLALGAEIAPLLKKGDVVALEGALGSGKTTLTRGALRHFCETCEVPSPSFTIAQCYALPSLALSLWHVDLYRIDSPSELEELGLEEADILIVEWAERMGGALPHERLHLRLAIEADDSRTAYLTPHGDAWRERLAAFLRNEPP